MLPLQLLGVALVAVVLLLPRVVALLALPLLFACWSRVAPAQLRHPLNPCWSGVVVGIL